MSKQNETNTCGQRFTVTYPSLELECSLAAYHDGPHHDEHQQYWWGHDDQTRDPWVQARREADAKRAAKRKPIWLRRRG